VRHCACGIPEKFKFAYEGRRNARQGVANIGGTDDLLDAEVGIHTLGQNAQTPPQSFRIGFDGGVCLPPDRPHLDLERAGVHKVGGWFTHELALHPARRTG